MEFDYLPGATPLDPEEIEGSEYTSGQVNHSFYSVVMLLSVCRDALEIL